MWTRARGELISIITENGQRDVDRITGNRARFSFLSQFLMRGSEVAHLCMVRTPKTSHVNFNTQFVTRSL